MAIVLALLAGLSYAGAAVLQQRVASDQAPELSLRPGLLLALVRQPVWLLGIALDVCAYFLEAGALATGTVVTVAPLLVSGLLFALPLSTIGGRGRVTRREWIPAIAVTGGLAVFVAVGSPEGDRSTASLAAWIVAGALVAVVSGTLVGYARTVDGARRGSARFRLVTWPMLAPVTLFTVVITAIRAFQVFDTVQVLTGGGPNKASEVLLHTIYSEAFGYFRVGYAAALVVVFLGFILVLSAIRVFVLDRRRAAQ